MATQTKIVYVDTASRKHKELGTGDTISSDKVASKPWATVWGSGMSGVTAGV